MNRQAPYVAAIHDLSGVGRCALTIVLPVLSAMGCQCAPLPTAYLSASTIYPPSDHFVFRDLTGEMEGSAAHWGELDIRFDAVYSGFVGSLRQLGVVQDFVKGFRGERTLVMVDPVMGDHGKTYRTYTPEMCREMEALARAADIITPNMTEAVILLHEPYDKAPDSEQGWREWVERLSLNGSRSVILTGIEPEKGMVGAACFDREKGAYTQAVTQKEVGAFPGTGDLFSSVALGFLLRGEDLAKATGRAVDFVALCARHTGELGTPVPQGVQFEDLLKELFLQ